MQRTWPIPGACSPVLTLSAWPRRLPAFPPPDVPDYASRSFRSNPLPPDPNYQPIPSGITGGWTRIDSFVDSRKDTSNHGPGPIPSVLSLTQRNRRLYAAADSARHQATQVSAERSAGRSDDQDEVVGERCDVFKGRSHTEAVKKVTPRSNSKSLSCVSSMESSFGKSSSVIPESSVRRGDQHRAEARISREVLPPADLFDLVSWLPKASTVVPRHQQRLATRRR